MPINNITQTISTIPEAGHRGVDVQTIFVTKQEDFQDHLQGTTVTELNTLKTQMNTMAGEMNTTASQVNTNANTATTKANEASASATSASASANTATTQAGIATTKASEASASALKASKWSDENYNIQVESGKYSAKHWAIESYNTLNTTNLLRADKYLSRQDAVNMIYNTNSKLEKVQYNNPTDVDYEILTYNVDGKLTNVAHYVGSVLKGNTVLSYVNGKLVSAPFTAV